MELAYVCEWEKRPKSTHCPSIPLVCSWSCRNLVAFTTDLKNDNEDKGNWQLCVIVSHSCCFGLQSQPDQLGYHIHMVPRCHSNCCLCVAAAAWNHGSLQKKYFAFDFSFNF